MTPSFEGPVLALFAGLLAICFVGAQILMQQGWLAAGPANDFLTFYSAAGASDVYSPAALEAARPEGFERLDLAARPYLRLPFHAALFAPLRLLPYATAYQVFQVLMAWCVVAFIFWWRPPTPLHTALFVCISAPLFFSFIRGQDLPLALLAVAASAYCVRQDQPFRAGLCLSLAAVQPQALLAVPLVIVAQRSWKLGAGLASGCAALGAASFAVVGPDWPQRFAAAWMANAPAASAAMPNLAGAAAGLGLDPLAAVGTAAVLAIAVYAIARSGGFALAIACALAAGALIAPRANLEDTVLLLPAALALLAETRSWTIRFCAAILLTPIGFALQGREEPIPGIVVLCLFALLLAGAQSLSRAGRSRREPLVQLGLS